MGTLIITNGDAAGERIRDARINGQILCWRDILHEGPVPVTKTLEELSAIRVEYLASGSWGDPKEIYDAFMVRDQMMRNLLSYSEIVLWFEHDLYDQLQLLQILDFLAGEHELHNRISLIQAGSFIGQETPSRLRMHLKLKRPISEMQFHLAQAAWNAFRAPAPIEWATLLHYDTSALPFLRHAILRHMEEMPSADNGLTRTERFILDRIYEGHQTPLAIFQLFGEDEEAPFMGDWSFWRILDGLSSGAAPFIAGLRPIPFSRQFSDEQHSAYVNSELKLTGLGVTTLHGKRDALDFRRLDRWMGGTHLTNSHCWRWDSAARRLIPPKTWH